MVGGALTGWCGAGLKHRGLANRSTGTLRPLIYLTYASATHTLLSLILGAHRLFSVVPPLPRNVPCGGTVFHDGINSRTPGGLHRVVYSGTDHHPGQLRKCCRPSFDTTAAAIAEPWFKDSYNFSKKRYVLCYARVFFACSVVVCCCVLRVCAVPTPGGCAHRARTAPLSTNRLQKRPGPINFDPPFPPASPHPSLHDEVP